MQLRKPKAVNQKLEAVIVCILDAMIEYGPESPEYPALLDHLQKLTALRQPTVAQPLNWNSMALVAGNIFGILVIVAYEHTHAMTSKALGFVQKSH